MVLVVVLAPVLAACAGSADKPEELNIFPTKFKDEILLQTPAILDDPTNIRGAFYSDPVLNPNGPINHYYSCVRFNPRGTNKQYLGSTDYIAHYFGGKLNQFLPASKEQCGTAPYKPFPELEKLCFGERCL